MERYAVSPLELADALVLRDEAVLRVLAEAILVCVASAFACFVVAVFACCGVALATRCGLAFAACLVAVVAFALLVLFTEVFERGWLLPLSIAVVSDGVVAMFVLAVPDCALMSFGLDVSVLAVVDVVLSVDGVVLAAVFDGVFAAVLEPAFASVLFIGALLLGALVFAAVPAVLFAV